jgi:voltage-gated potassium channel Kch
VVVVAVLGLILVLVAAGAAILLFEATRGIDEGVPLEAYGLSATVLPVGLLIAGAAVVATLWLGVVLLRATIRRTVRRRREAKETRAEAQAAHRREEAAAEDHDDARRHSPAAPLVPARRSSRRTEAAEQAASPTSREPTRPTHRGDQTQPGDDSAPRRGSAPGDGPEGAGER